MVPCLLAAIALSARAAPVEAPAPPADLAALVLPASALGLGDMRWNAGAASLGGATLDALGRGDFGAVYAHPAEPSQVVKISADGFGVTRHRSLQDMERDALAEAARTRQLARIGAGPELVAVTRVSHRLQPLLDRMAAFFRVPAPDWSRPALVKERVIGRTVADLRRTGDWTPRHEELARELRARLRAAGLRSLDMHDENVMIGRTARRPYDEAHLVDAGGVRSALSAPAPTP